MSLTLAQAHALVEAAMRASAVGPAQARAIAHALATAEAMGQPGHGLSRVPSYALHARCGKADGRAEPRLTEIAPAAVRVDARAGFAYLAFEMALADLLARTPRTGIAVAAIVRSHHFGQAGLHALALARAGLIGLVFGNTPKAMAFHGGRAARLGTNPIAFAAPVPGGDPVIVDLALSTVARGKIMAAKGAGAAIPEGWALDAEGRPTTDPAAALGGSMLPIAGAKGAALALMVEILAAALAGGAWGWEASSMFDDRGGPPDLAQIIIAIDAAALSAGGYGARMGDLAATIAEEPEVRLPGARALAAFARAQTEGVMIPAALHREIQTLIDTPV